MAFKLKLKRGTAAPSNTALDIAEPGYDTSGKKLYIGNGSGVAASGVSMDGHTHSANDITGGTLAITTLPTITVPYGGTGITSYATGDILYASGTSALSKLGIGSTNQILTVVGGLPTWANAGTAAQVANSLVLKFDTGTTEGTDVYTFNGSAAKTIDIKAGTGIDLSKSVNAIQIIHEDTSTLTGAQGGNGISGFTVDGLGHVTAVTTATYLTAQSTDFKTVTVTGTDSGYTWTATGSAVAETVGDTLTLVDGAGIDIHVDAANDAVRIQHADTSTQANVSNSGNTFIQSITLDTYGHITAATSGTVTQTQLSLGTQVGTGNVITDVSVSNHQITVTKGITALTAESDTLATVTARGASTTTDLSLGNVTMTGYLRGPANFVIDPSTHGDDTGTVVIAGNLTVQGTTTTINSNTVSIGDSIVVLNGDEVGVPSQNAGIEVERGTSTNTSLLWDEAVDRWTFINPDSTVVTVPNTTGTIALTSQLHNRSHAMTSTSDHTAGNWKVFYSNGSGNVIELALGAVGTVLTSAGTAAAPTFSSVVTSFIGLTDTPSVYNAVDAGKLVAVNPTYNGLEFINELDCGTYAV